MALTYEAPDPRAYLDLSLDLELRIFRIEQAIWENANSNQKMLRSRVIPMHSLI